MHPTNAIAPRAATTPRTHVGYEWKAVTLLCLGFGLVGIGAIFGGGIAPVIAGYDRRGNTP